MARRRSARSAALIGRVLDTARICAENGCFSAVIMALSEPIARGLRVELGLEWLPRRGAGC
jgi:hypothetical protein